ncbi:phenylalanine ammonia-lyase [Acrasis kona]|uniref:Phenylalanine ammonia-lyase n=1 Tax=Acrasis kona TaxID=1008807 RepID=A0AAW2YVS0_9EUKA
MLIFSVHGDTNFKNHQLHTFPDGRIQGHLDNFAGVHCIMNAYFSGKLNKDYVRVEITYGEETDMEGARELRKEITPRDVIVVIDVTGTVTQKSFVIEKCFNAKIRRFLNEILADMDCDVFENCPDEIAQQDETDVYRKVAPFCFFLGVPVQGGDYNEGMVFSHVKTLEAVKEAVIRIVEKYPDFVERHALNVNTEPKNELDIDEGALGFLTL